MATERVTVQYNADDQRSGLTLAEMAVFVQEAMRMDVPPETPLHVAVGFLAQIRSITTADGRPRR